MQTEKFEELWEKGSQEWYKSACITINGTKRSVSDFCTLKKNYASIIHERYEIIKKVVKREYFAISGKKLNKYKRAAVIAYAINGAIPLQYKEMGEDPAIDPYYLKQRLAFYIAAESIVQEYQRDEVQKEIDKGKKIFDVPQRSVAEKEAGVDSFFEGVYKDMFFAEAYRNYNVLTMANVFLLLTERASFLSDLTPLPTIEEAE